MTLHLRHTFSRKTPCKLTLVSELVPTQATLAMVKAKSSLNTTNLVFTATNGTSASKYAQTDSIDLGASTTSATDSAASGVDSGNLCAKHASQKSSAKAKSKVTAIFTRLLGSNHDL